MSEFSKPLLTDEAPEPPLLEPKLKDDVQLRIAQPLAKTQGAQARLEEAGLAPKPARPVKSKAEKSAAATKPLIKTDGQSAKPVVPITHPRQAETKVETSTPDPEQKVAAGSDKAPEVHPEPDVDKDLRLRQAALTEVVASMQANPDPEIFHHLFKLFEPAPPKEAQAAALLLSITYLRTPATARQPLLKAMQPSMKAHRNTKLAAFLLVKLGAALVAKPPAPPPPAPPGG